MSAMTLECKPRHIMYPTTYGSKTMNKLPPTRLARPRHPNSQPTQTSSSVVRRTGGLRDSTGENFLQRLLEIERRHDEKRLFRQKAAATNNSNNNDNGVRDDGNNAAVLDHGTAFHRSPTRWISEQIFDDTREDTQNLPSSERESFHNNNNGKTQQQQPFYASPYCRLPNLSDLHVISTNSSYTDPSSSPSVFMPSTKQRADSEYALDSLSSLSYVELPQPSDDFPVRRSPVVRKRPLKLPPILLPPIYTLRPRPLKDRDFLTPTRIRGPITDDEWEDLRQCRYIRPAPPGRFQIPLSSSQSEVSLL